MEVIRENKQEIMKRWQKLVVEKIPTVSSQNKLSLYNSLPDYLDNLSLLLAPEDQDDLTISESKQDLIGKVHGQHRANNSYSIEQMVEEYFILKDVIIGLLKERNELTLDTYEKISHSFERTLQTSVSQFSHSLLEAQENFVLSLAHDLRSPLMVIKMQSELMLKKASFLPSYGQKIIKSVDKVDGMIEFLLDSVRSKKHWIQSSDAKDFDLLQVVKEVASEYEALYPGVIQIHGETTYVRWDKRSIERVLDNLISNALKNGEDAKAVTVKIDKDDNTVFFSVHNHGQPIPPEEQKFLFHKFTRTVSSKDKKGWGIGLNYVKTVIEAHKGIVLVHSDEDGTIFKSEIPKGISDSDAMGVRIAKET